MPFKTVRLHCLHTIYIFSVTQIIQQRIIFWKQGFHIPTQCKHSGNILMCSVS